jgi:hypothetical protein
MSLFDVVMFGGMSSGSPDGASANRQNLPRKPLPKGPSRSANASRRLGYERLREIADPALALERTRENWRKLGRSEKWITQRMTGQETRNKLTDYWAAHEVKQGQEFARSSASGLCIWQPPNPPRYDVPCRFFGLR